MSATTDPISPARFAEALTSLPLPNLHTKAAEIRNSISHLQSSNEQLQSFAEEGDADCADAVRENREVIGRMEERIGLLRAEVEGRGFKWGEDDGLEEGMNERVEGGGDGEVDGNGEENGGRDEMTTMGNGQAQHRSRTTGGRLGDEELARRLRERMEEDGDGEGDGVHL